MDDLELEKLWDFKKNKLQFTDARKDSVYYWKCKSCGAEIKKKYNNFRRTVGLCKECLTESRKHYRKTLKDWCSEHNREDILEFWDYEKNLKEFGVTPDTVGCEICNYTKETRGHYYWKCSECGKECVRTILSVINTKPRCEECKSKQRKLIHSKVKEGNDLLTWSLRDRSGMGELLLRSWNDKTTLMSEVNRGSERRIKLKCCFCGNEWEPKASAITIYHQWCPKCRVSGTSFPERVVYEWCKKNFNEVYSRCKVEEEEADIYIGDIDLVIEYQGVVYHTPNQYRDNHIAIQKDNQKLRIFKENHHNVLWITEWECEREDVDSICHIYQKSEYSFQCLIEQLSQYLHEKFNIKTSTELSSEMMAEARFSSRCIPYERSLAHWCNEHGTIGNFISAAWMEEKNREELGITLENVSYGSDICAYFKCPDCGYEFRRRITNMTYRKGTKCPVDCGYKIICDVNSFGYWCSTFAGDRGKKYLDCWDYEKNDGISPWNIYKGDCRKFWFKNKEGKEWQSSPSKVRRGVC